MLQDKWIDQPSTTTLQGRERRPQIRVWKNKPPKLRFRPGIYVKYQGQIHELLYVYRCKPDTQEWIFVLEERKGLEAPALNPKSAGDRLSAMAESMGAGVDTPRIVYEIFRSSSDAMSFFSDIPAYGDRVHLRNKEMLKLEVASSGSVQ
jgi:hypothetical protein